MRRGIGRLRAGGSGGFSPASLFAAGEQGAWYDPSDFTTLFQDSAGTTPVTATTQPVGKVLDKSGRANHLIQATASARPTLQQDGSGFYYLLFDGLDDCLATAAALNLSGTQNAVLWAGSRKSTDATAGIVCELTPSFSANPGGFWFANANGAAANLSSRLSGSVGNGGYDAVTYTAPISTVASLSFFTGGGTLAAGTSLRVNGLATTSGPTGAAPGGGNLANNTFFVGSRNSSGIFLTGRIYQLILRGASTTDVAPTETYVGAKMGISL